MNPADRVQTVQLTEEPGMTARIVADSWAISDEGVKSSTHTQADRDTMHDSTSVSASAWTTPTPSTLGPTFSQSDSVATLHFLVNLIFIS